jgi:uncharacterized sporulation protein YeaH/YhbH (DUF444 family)
MNAVMTFVMDGSGSFMDYYEMARRMIYDMKVLLKQNYKAVEFRFVVFDMKAHEVTEKQFFTIQLGGGTSYAEGVKLAHGIFENNYPRNEWDRFTTILGDLEDSPEQAMSEMKSLADDSEYVAVVRGSEWEGMDELKNQVQAESQNSPYFGFVDLGKRKVYDINDLRKLFKNEEP